MKVGIVVVVALWASFQTGCYSHSVATSDRTVAKVRPDDREAGSIFYVQMNMTSMDHRPSSLMKPMSMSMQDLEPCLIQGLKTSADQNLKVNIQWSLNDKGQFRELKIIEMLPQDNDFESCLLLRLQQLRFSVDKRTEGHLQFETLPHGSANSIRSIEGQVYKVNINRPRKKGVKVYQ